MTGQTVAIKLLRNLLSSEYNMIKVLREVQLLKALSEMDDQGRFITKLLDADLYWTEDDGACHLFIV